MSAEEVNIDKSEYVIKEGDFILIDYIGIIKETGEVFDTTIEEEAKKAGIYSESQRYSPQLVVVGKRWVVEGLDESLIGKKEGDDFEVEVPPEKGYGRRDSKKIVTTTIRKLRKSGLKGDIRPGMVLEVNGVPAVVKAVVSGRVMLDFNPPLAGKTLRYKVWIKKILKTKREKIKALIERYSPELVRKASISVKKQTVEINFKNYLIENIQLTRFKKKIGDDILDNIEDIKRVRFIEEMSREKSESASP